MSQEEKDIDDGPLRLESLGPQTPTINTTLQQARNAYSSMTLKQLQKGSKYRQNNNFMIKQLGSVSSDTTNDRYYVQRKQQLQNIKKSELKYRELQAQEEEEAKQQLIQKEEERIRRIQEQKILQQRIKAENQARRAQSQLNFKQLPPSETNVKELIDFFQKPRLEYQQQLQKKYNKLAISKAELKQQNQLIYYGILDGKADKYKFDYQQCHSILKPYIDRKIEEIKHNLHQFKGREIYDSIFNSRKQQASNRVKKSSNNDDKQGNKQQKNKSEKSGLQNQQPKNNLQQHDLEIILNDLTVQNAAVLESKNQLLKNQKINRKEDDQLALSAQNGTSTSKYNENNKKLDNNHSKNVNTHLQNAKGKQNSTSDSKLTMSDLNKSKPNNQKNKQNNEQDINQNNKNNLKKNKSNDDINISNNNEKQRLSNESACENNDEVNESSKNKQNSSKNQDGSQQKIQQSNRGDLYSKIKGTNSGQASQLSKKSGYNGAKGNFQLNQYNDKYNMKKDDGQNKQQVQQVTVFAKAKKYHFSQLESVQDLEQIRNVYNMFQIYTFQIEILEEEFKMQHKQDYQCNLMLIKNVNHQLNIQTVQKDINDIISYLQQLLYDDRQNKNQNNSRNALNNALKQLLVVLNKRCAENVIQNFCLPNQGKYTDGSINKNTFIQFQSFLNGTISEDSKFVDRLVSKMRIFIKQLIFQYNKNNNFSIKNVEFLEQLQDKFTQADLDQFAPQLIQELSGFIIDTYIKDENTKSQIQEKINEVCHTQSYLDKITLVLYDIFQKQNKLILFDNFVNFIAKELYSLSSMYVVDEAKDNGNTNQKPAENLNSSGNLMAQMSMKLEGEKQKMKAKQEQLSNRYRYK